MIKLVLSVLCLSVLLSCRTEMKKETNRQNPTEMEKKNIGKLLALYPKPMTVMLSDQTPLDPANRINNFIQ